MARTQASRAAYSDAAFASVFPAKSIQPPKTSQPFESRAKTSAEDIRTVLHTELKALLGVENEDFLDGISIFPEEGVIERADLLSEIGDCFARILRVHQSIIAQSGLWHHLRTWQSQLGASQLKKLIAGELDKSMTEFVAWAYSGHYHFLTEHHLHFWVDKIFSEVTESILRVINSSNGISRQPEKDSQVGLHDTKKWLDMALARLGALRVDELFNMIVDWDEDDNGLENLKAFTTNPATRSYLTTNFSNVLLTRLLHPGASTIEILQLYISTIRAFRKLDPKGVLLDRVARRMRRYLKDREDTVKVIVSGLLSDPVDDQGHQAQSSPDVLTELAIELSRRDADEGRADEGDFDWNNMDWIPDPVDAAPDYIKSKNTDVVGSLISLFESKDVFVRELQTALADRLLKHKPDFDQEISVLEHLKIRFGDSALQGCEVMLRDVLDSRKVDNVIRRDQGMQNDKGQTLQPGLQLHAKILSRLFWPSMSDQSFNLPASVLEQQASYEKGFEALKQSRKLTWLNGLGQVEVELELADRVFAEEVLPWQASVIYAFQDNGPVPVSKDLAQLASALDMSPVLVRSACIFWVSRRVLVETSKDTFTVLERLPDGDESVTAEPAARNDVAVAAAAAAAAQAAKEVEETERKQRMAMYHQFILSMLTNQGAMPLPRIAMMLGIVVPGGFPFSNEELKEFLSGMVKDGFLEFGHGGAYKVAS